VLLLRSDSAQDPAPPLQEQKGEGKQAALHRGHGHDIRRQTGQGHRDPVRYVLCVHHRLVRCKIGGYEHSARDAVNNP
jgi:hypothetical protein